MNEPYPFSQCQTIKPQDIDKILASGDYIMEPKIDGWRMQMYVSPNQVKTWTRTAHDATGKMEAAEAALREFAQTYDLAFVLDGEAVFMDADLEPNFNLTARIMGSGLEVAKEKVNASHGFLTFFIFDILMYDGKDMRSFDWDIRTTARQMMASLLRSPYVQFVPYQEPSVENHDFNIKTFKEGSILKLKSAPYAGKRHKSWLKWKLSPDADVVIVGFKDGEGKYRGQVGAVQFGQYTPEGNLMHRGACSGMSDHKRAWITEHKDELIGQVLQIKHYGLLANGGFRHPQWQHLREDKLAYECIWSS